MRGELRALLALLIGLGWATTVLAASAAPADLIGLPWTQIGLGAGVSLWGGLTRTAGRLTEPRDVARPPLRVELVRDLIVSAGCGFVTYGLGAWGAWNVWLLGVSLFGAGYAGARYLDAVADAVMARATRAVKGGEDV